MRSRPSASVSAVSTVNRPIVPVVASIGRKFGTGLESAESASDFFLLAACGAGAAGAGGASFPAFAEDVTAASLASAGFACLRFAGVRAKTAGIKTRPSVTSVPALNSNRIMNVNLRGDLEQRIISKHYNRIASQLDGNELRF